MSELEISELETAGELHDRLAADGAPLTLRVVESLATGTANETVQDESLATQAPKLSRASAKLDWTRPASDLARQIRGLYPWPGCRVRIVETNVTLVRARAWDDSSAVAPGTIDAKGFVSCGSGSLEIVELQPEGKRPMSLASFRNGHAWDAGMRLKSL